LKLAINYLNTQMKNFFLKFNISIVLIAIGFLGFINPVLAENEDPELIEVQLWNSSEYEDLETQSIFNESNFLPGDTTEGRIKIKNISDQDQNIGVEAINFGDNGSSNLNDVDSNSIARHLIFKIKLWEGEYLYGGDTDKTLYDFYSEGTVNLDILTPDASEEFLFEVYYPKEKEDQEVITTQFDLLFGAVGEENGQDDEEEDGEGSSGGGGSVVIYPRGLTITGESEQDCNELPCATALISWHTNYLSTSKVIYGTSSGQFDFSEGPEKYGYDFYKKGDTSGQNKVTSHEVELTGLIPGTIYYYRCVSHASPETVGDEHSFTTCALADDEKDKGETGEEGDFEEKETASEEEKESSAIVAEDTSVSTSPEESSEEEGEEATTTEEEIQEKEEKEQEASLLASLKSLLGDFGTVCFDCFPWWVLLILALYPLYRCCFTKKEDKKEFISWFAWTALHLIVAAILYLSGYLCLPLWVFIISALGTLLFWHTYAQDKKRAQKITLVGLILILIFLILLLILECLYAWLILFLILIFFSYLLAIGRGDSREARQMSLPSN
jgi:hypothetical protein